MSTVWVTAGVPRPTVTTYSKVSTERPSVVGTVASPRFAPAVPLRPFRMPSARSRSRRSTSAVEGMLAVAEEGNGEQGPRRWFNGSQASLESGMLTVVKLNTG